MCLAIFVFIQRMKKNMKNGGFKICLTIKWISIFICAHTLKTSTFGNFIDDHAFYLNISGRSNQLCTDTFFVQHYLCVCLFCMTCFYLVFFFIKYIFDNNVAHLKQNRCDSNDNWLEKKKNNEKNCPTIIHPHKPVSTIIDIIIRTIFSILINTTIIQINYAETRFFPLTCLSTHIV